MTWRSLLLAGGLSVLGFCLLFSSTVFAQNFISPTSAPPQTCTNGTGVSITSVGTTAVTVCAASPSFKRSWWRIANAGSSLLYCTDDGSTPTSTNWDFTVPAVSWTTSAGAQNVSPLALVCVAASGTDTINASVVQSGAP